MQYRRRTKNAAVKRRRVVALLAAAAAVIIFFEVRLKPVTGAVAEIQAQALAVGIINRSVTEILEETGISAESLETVSLLPDGTVSSISSDTVAANRLKNAITMRVQENISGVRSHRIDVPLGTVIGTEIMSGTGPSIPLFISLSGSVTSDFESSFEQGGLNQTVHKLSVRILANINIIMPLDAVSTCVETSVLVGETVIVGKVPSGSILRAEQRA